MITGQSKGIYQCSGVGDTLIGRYRVSYFRWVGATTAGHQCIVKEGGSTGAVLFKSEADGANFLDVMALHRWADGLYVDTLGSGTVFIYTI